MKKILNIFIGVIMVFTMGMLLACDNSTDITTLSEEELTELYGSNFKMENTTANQEYLFGLCDIAWSNFDWFGISYTQSTELANMLGVKSIRNWMHANWIMDTPTDYNESKLSLMRSIVDDIKQYDFQLIGMNHSNFHDGGYTNSGNYTAKPERDLTPGSSYMQWLEDYKTTWYNIVIKFPEIKYWEIDNEPNNDVFFPKLSGGNFTLKEKAAIYTDMMYFASQGIHEANPEAVTIMGGLIISTAETFLQYVYDNIFSEDSWSQYPDDYFQVACWHPYISNFTKENFVKTNNDIYNVIKTNEGKDKKVFFTELGWSESQVNKENIANFIKQMYEVTLEQLPYVESIHYFRLYDEINSNWGSVAERQFGLFTDPKSHGEDNYNPYLCMPKPAAYAYQEIANGTGDLEKFKTE